MDTSDQTIEQALTVINCLVWGSYGLLIAGILWACVLELCREYLRDAWEDVLCLISFFSGGAGEGVANASSKVIHH